MEVIAFATLSRIDLEEFINLLNLVEQNAKKGKGLYLLDYEPTLGLFSYGFHELKNSIINYKYLKFTNFSLKQKYAIITENKLLVSNSKKSLEKIIVNIYRVHHESWLYSL